jgi:hypothetical protein
MLEFLLEKKGLLPAGAWFYNPGNRFSLDRGGTELLWEIGADCSLLFHGPHPPGVRTFQGAPKTRLNNSVVQVSLGIPVSRARSGTLLLRGGSILAMILALNSVEYLVLIIFVALFRPDLNTKSLSERRHLS